MFLALKNIAYLLAAASVGFALLYFVFKEHRRLIFCLAYAFGLPVCIAFLSPSVLVANILIGLVMLSFWRERVHFGAIYVFGLLTLPLISQPVNVGGVYLLNFSFGDAYTIAALIGFLIGGHVRKSKSNFADGLVSIIIAIFYLATVRETSLTNSLREFINFLLSYIIPYYIISRSIRDPQQANSIMISLAGSAVVLATIAVFEVRNTWPLYRSIWVHYGIELGNDVAVKIRGGLMRAAGPYPEPLSLAFAMSVGLIALLSLRQQIQKGWHYALLCAVVVAGLIAPQGRGAWIGALCAIFALDLYRRNYRRLAIKSALIGIAGVMALALSTINNRVAIMLGLTAEGQGTFDYREQLLVRGIEEFWKNPLLGDAIGDVLYNMQDLIQGEGIVDLVNGYLHIALISGATGLISIVVCLAGIASMLLKIRDIDDAPKILRDATAFSFVSLIAIAAMLTSMTFVGRPLLTLIIVLGVGAGAASFARISHQTNVKRNANLKLEI